MNRRQFVLTLNSTALLAQTVTEEPALEWVDARKLSVEGLRFKDVKLPFDRLASRAEDVVPAPVWSLGRDSAGVLVRFTASTTAIYARWTITNPNLAGSRHSASVYDNL